MSEFAGWQFAADTVAELIATHGARRVLEVGSGANPTLDMQRVSSLGIEYTVNDNSEAELAKADPCYERLLMDVSSDDPAKELCGRFDFIFSRMVNEHVQDGRRYYQNIRRMLAPGGVTAHWFSTLYALPFLINRCMPEWLGGKLLRTVAPRDAHRQGKFRAYYSWSRGPSARMIRRFESLGFEVRRYEGYFGHYYYHRAAPWLHRLELLKTDWLVRHPLPCLTSYAHLLMRAV